APLGALAGSSRNGSGRKYRCSCSARQSRRKYRVLFRYGKAKGQDVDGGAFLKRKVVVAVLHLGNLDDDLVSALLHHDGFVIGFVVREKYGSDGAFSEVRSRDGDGVAHFTGGGIDSRDAR